MSLPANRRAFLCSGMQSVIYTGPLCVTHLILFLLHESDSVRSPPHPDRPFSLHPDPSNRQPQSRNPDNRREVENTIGRPALISNRSLPSIHVSASKWSG